MNSRGLTSCLSETIAKSLCDPSIEHLSDTISFWLPGHKADQYFEGIRLFIQNTNSSTLIFPRMTSSSMPDPNYGFVLMEQSLLVDGLSSAYGDSSQSQSLVNLCMRVEQQH